MRKQCLKMLDFGEASKFRSSKFKWQIGRSGRPSPTPFDFMVQQWPSFIATTLRWYPAFLSLFDLLTSSHSLSLSASWHGLPPVTPNCERAILYASFVVECSQGLSDCAPRARCGPRPVQLLRGIPARLHHDKRRSLVILAGKSVASASQCSLHLHCWAAPTCCCWGWSRRNNHYFLPRSLYARSASTLHHRGTCKSFFTYALEPAGSLQWDVSLDIMAIQLGFRSWYGVLSCFVEAVPILWTRVPSAQPCLCRIYTFEGWACRWCLHVI